MVAAASRFPLEAPPPVAEPRVLLPNVPWATYVMLRDTIESPGVRMTYLEGWLEIMSPSRKHEVSKTQIGRFLELFCLEKDIPLFGYGSTTFRREEKQRGLEPDECYSRGGEKEIPDIALEVVISRGSIDKLEVYRGLGVREVWVFHEGAFEVFELTGDRYVAIAVSRILPELDLACIAHFVAEPDQHAALKAYRDELRRIHG